MNTMNNYIEMLHKTYDGGTNNHPGHNSNPHYWSILLGSVVKNKELFEGKKALDFGCGKGRNVTNMLSLTNWNRVDGVDISIDNINFCKETNSPEETKFYLNNGKDLSEIPDSEYEFVMSTIVLQHLCVYDLRFGLLKEIHRVMKSDGLFSFQMGYGADGLTVGSRTQTEYYSNNLTAAGSNGLQDVRITDPKQITTDLEKIGFKNVKYVIQTPWEDGGHPNWIYVEATKI